MSPKPSTTASARRHGAIAVVLALATGVLAACDEPPRRVNTAPWTASITEPLARLQLEPAPPTNFRSVVYVQSVWGNENYSHAFTRSVTRVAPTHVLTRNYITTLTSPRVSASHCFANRDEVIALGGLVILGMRTDHSNCSWFPGNGTTEWQQTGRLFPMAVGNTLTTRRAWTSSDGSTGRTETTWRVVSVHDGIALNGFRIGGPIYFVRAESNDGREEFYWSELLGHWVVRRDYDRQGRQTSSAELLAASGVEPRTIGGARAEVQGNPARPGAEFSGEQHRLATAFTTRRASAHPRLDVPPGWPGPLTQTAWYYCGGNLYFQPVTLGVQQHIFYEWMIEAPPGDETPRFYALIRQNDMSEVTRVRNYFGQNFEFFRHTSRAQDFVLDLRQRSGNFNLRTYYVFDPRTGDLETFGFGALENGFETHRLASERGACQPARAPRIR